MRDILIMIYDPVPVVRVRVMFQALKQFYLPVTVQLFHQVGKACIEQLQPTHLPDIGFDHHAVHPFDGRGYLHSANTPNGVFCASANAVRDCEERSSEQSYEKCISCGKWKRVCPMNVDVTDNS